MKAYAIYTTHTGGYSIWATVAYRSMAETILGRCLTNDCVKGYIKEVVV